MRERLVIASILQDPAAELPATLARVLEFAPEGFDAPELGAIAAALRTARSNGKPADLPGVGKHLSADNAGALSQLANESGSALPLALAEIEACALLKRMLARRIAETLGEAWHAAEADPANAATVAEHCRKALAQLDGEAEPGITEAVPIGELQRQEAGDRAELVRCRYLCGLAPCSCAGRLASAKAHCCCKCSFRWDWPRGVWTEAEPPAHVSTHSSRE